MINDKFNEMVRNTVQEVLIYSGIDYSIIKDYLETYNKTIIEEALLDNGLRLEHLEKKEEQKEIIALLKDDWSELIIGYFIITEIIDGNKIITRKRIGKSK
jgi:hypothetical protein